MTYDLACTITGAGGFVGSQLCRGLMEQTDYKIRIFAIDKTPGRLVFGGYKAPADAKSFDLEWLENGSHLTFHEYDVHQPLNSNFLAVDAIYHFAGIANPDTYLKDPILVMDLNLMGLKNILERIALWSAHRPRIIYSSTSEVYGMNQDVPFDEEESLHVFSDQRRWCYALSKLVGEQYLRAYADHGIRSTIFRFFNFVGPDIDAPGAGRVLTRMVGSALDEGVIWVTEPGTQTRCFTHQDDFVEPLIRAMTMKRWLATEESIGQFDHAWDHDYTINLGSDEEVDMFDLAVRIGQILREMQAPIPGGWGDSQEGGLQITLKPKEEVYGKGYEDCQRRQPSIERARSVLGWTPRRRLDDFLPELVAAIVERHLQGRARVESLAELP